jgi:hypothetical protein
MVIELGFLSFWEDVGARVITWKNTMERLLLTACLAVASDTAVVEVPIHAAVAKSLPRKNAASAWMFSISRLNSNSPPTFPPKVRTNYLQSKDQFISITAACWATTALVLALPAAQ